MMTEESEDKLEGLLTSSDNAKTEEENDATQITTQTGLVGAIDGYDGCFTFFLCLSDYHYVVVQNPHNPSSFVLSMLLDSTTELKRERNKTRRNGMELALSLFRSWF